jgi:hypothetical protein
MCELEVVEVVEKGSERDASFEPGEWRADAVVDAAAEREVRVLDSAQVEDIGVGEDARVTVRRARTADHHAAGSDGATVAERDGLTGDAHGHLHGRVEAEQLLDCGGIETRVGSECIEGCGLSEESDEAVSEQVRRGLVSGDEQQDEHADEFVAVERVRLVFMREQS